MIEEIVLKHLKSKINDVPIYTMVPANPPEEFVLIERTGSAKVNHINKATFAIQSYGATLYKAASLNEIVKSAMDSLAELETISKSALESDYNYTDTSMKKYRYQALYSLVY